MKIAYSFETPIGRLCAVERGGALVSLSLAAEADAAQAGDSAPTPLLAAARMELSEYFAGRRQTFTLPLAPEGTPWQRRVWEALQRIPYGETRSYGEIARMAGNPKAARAVGRANNRNPLLILIPCHRVIGADGSLTGYGGGLDVKARLLALEGAAWREGGQKVGKM